MAQRDLPSCIAVGSCVAIALFLAKIAHATDPFEIQVYDGTANAPGVPGLELHVNNVVRGSSDTNPPELPQNHQTHFTLEPSIGVTSFWELGAYFQTALLGDGSFDYAGVKLRSKFVTPPDWTKHWRLGLNLEISLLPQAFDRNRWGMELRPIAAWENDDWMFVVNPIVDVALAGPEAPGGPSFEPAGMALFKIQKKVALGFEYYANFGPFSDFLPLAKQEHYLYEAVNVLVIRNFELNIGFGQGLTEASHRYVAKFIVGYSWERAPHKIK